MAQLRNPLLCPADIYRFPSRKWLQISSRTMFFFFKEAVRITSWTCHFRSLSPFFSFIVAVISFPFFFSSSTTTKATRGTVSRCRLSGRLFPFFFIFVPTKKKKRFRRGIWTTKEKKTEWQVKRNESTRIENLKKTNDECWLKRTALNNVEPFPSVGQTEAVAAGDLVRVPVPAFDTEGDSVTHFLKYRFKKKTNEKMFFVVAYFPGPSRRRFPCCPK